MRPGRRRWAATERVPEGFPDRAHDDEVDAGSGALEMLNPPMKSWAAYEIAPQDAEAILAAQQRKPQPAPPDPARGLRPRASSKSGRRSPSSPAPCRSIPALWRVQISSESCKFEVPR